MPNMVDANGAVRFVPDDQVVDAMAQGFQPETIDQNVARAAQGIKEEEYGGASGKVAALGLGALRGVTLGGSDVLASALGAGDTVDALKSVNPITSTIGEIGGGLASAYAAPTSLLGKTPAGYLSRLANEAVGSSHALGGARGLAASMAVTGTEAAAQNAGMYLADVALGNRDLTAEGLGGAVGSGFVFGSAAGGAIGGISRGTMAARRLFSNVMEGGEDATRSAASLWERKSTEAFDANRQTLETAKQQLAEAQAAERAAALEKQFAAERLTNEKLYAARAAKVAPEPEGVSGAAPYQFASRAGAAADEVAGAPVLAAKPPEVTTPDAKASITSSAVKSGKSSPPVSSAAESPDPILDHVKLNAQIEKSGTGYYDQSVPSDVLQRRGYYVEPVDPDFGNVGGPIVATMSRDGKITVVDGQQTLDEALSRGGPLDVKWAFGDQPTAAATLRESVAPKAPRAPLGKEEFDAFKDSMREVGGSEFFAAGMHYSKYGDESMNGALRSGKTVDQLTGDDLRAGRVFEDAFADPRSAIPRETTLYRGVSSQFAHKTFADAKPGDLLPADPGYLSTTADAGSKLRSHEITFEIHAPAGTRALPISSKYDGEREFLLPRNTQFRVTDNRVVPYKPDATKFQGATDYEVMADQTVRVLEDGKWTSWPPIRVIEVEIVPSIGKQVPTPATNALADQVPITQAERDAVDSYTSGEYKLFNSRLRGTEHRGGLVRGDRELMSGQTVDQAIDEMDRLIARSPLPEDLVTYRGLTNKTFKIGNAKVGDVITDKGYQSVSANREVADRFTKYSGLAEDAPAGGGYVLELTVPRGTPAINASKIMGGAEAEYVLPRGLSYEITGIDGKTISARVRETGSAPASTSRPISTAASPEVQRLSAVVQEAESAESDLMRLLGQTKQQLDAGSSIQQLNYTRGAVPTSPAQLTSRYDQIVEQAAQAADIETKQALLRQADVLESQLAQLPPSQAALTEIQDVAKAMARYEKATADLVDELGDAANPVSREIADAVRKADTDAERRMMDRATQAIDSHVDDIGKQAPKRFPNEPHGPWNPEGPVAATSKERVRYAKDRKLEADAAFTSARSNTMRARDAQQLAKSAVDATKQAVETVGLPGRPATPANANMLGSVGVGLELADIAGIPGLPRPADLPIVGPLLSLYLKAKALKAGAERLMGRIPATGNARVASAAAQTKDRAAKVVDRVLGIAERAVPATRSGVATTGPRLVELVRQRLLDDDEDKPKDTDDIRDHVLARSREAAKLSSNPALIVAQVRREMRDVADPDMVAAAIKFRTNQVKYLADVAPKEPPTSPFDKPWKPTKAESVDFARKYAVAMDPVQALEQVEQKCLTPEAAEAFRAVYPLLFAQTQERLLNKAVQLQQSIPRQQLFRLSILFDIPLDSALEPSTLASLQAAHAITSPATPAPQPGPPTSSVANPTDLTAMYQTSADRRAALR